MIINTTCADAVRSITQCQKILCICITGQTWITARRLFSSKSILMRTGHMRYYPERNTRHYLHTRISFETKEVYDQTTPIWHKMGYTIDKKEEDVYTGETGLDPNESYFCRNICRYYVYMMPCQVRASEYRCAKCGQRFSIIHEYEVCNGFNMRHLYHHGDTMEKRLESMEQYVKNNSAITHKHI